MATYETKCWGDTYRLAANFAEASSPVKVEDVDGNWQSTQYQVADFRHRPEAAMRRILEETAAMGDDPDDEEDAIEAAVESMREVE